MPRMNSSLLPGQPLTPAVFHVLLALVDGDKHGYAIMKDVETQTAGRLKLGAVKAARLKRLSDTLPG